MAAGKTLRLVTHSYDQRQADGRDADVITRRHGEVFKARTAEEYDRLTSLGAAEDPEVEAEREHAKLEQRKAALTAERQRIDEQLKATTARK